MEFVHKYFKENYGLDKLVLFNQYEFFSGLKEF